VPEVCRRGFQPAGSSPGFFLYNVANDADRAVLAFSREGSVVKFVFVNGRVAISVRYWEERGEVIDGGARSNYAASTRWKA
jgi:hypothetical protein